MSQDDSRIETKVIHAGEPRPRLGGAVSLPVFQSSTFEYDGQSSYHDVRYIRLNNTPNHVALHEKLAALEGADAALVTSSGMSAITTALLTVLKTGDHILAQSTLYGGTHQFIAHDLADFGIEYDFIDGNDPDDWRQKLRPTTKAVYVESMSNPLLEVGDLIGIAAFAKEKGLVSLIDNTFPSPVNFRPSEHGFDVSLHSATKYLNGHTDIVAGAIIGSHELIEKTKHRLDHLGGSLDPHACFLLQRGMKTLVLRVERQNQNALQIAEYLAAHPKVASVNYPGLTTHTHHKRARDLFDGFGGMLSFEIDGGIEVANEFMGRLEIPVVAPSLGGVETLVTLPATTSHAGLDPEHRRSLGVSDSLIRLSVGIEAADDLVADLDQALGG